MPPRLLALLLTGALALFALFPVVTPARAGEAALDLLDAPIPYNADFTMQGPKGRYSGTVWHLPGRERREVETKGGGQGILIHRDTATAYFLGVGGKWYVALSLDAAASLIGGLNSWQVDRQRVGSATLLGQRVTHWKARASGPKGGFDGEIWTTRDDIVVKAVGTVSSPGGAPSPVDMTLTRLDVGEVDRRMLEVPEGWFGLDLHKIPPEQVVQVIEGMKPMLERRGGRP